MCAMCDKNLHKTVSSVLSLCKKLAKEFQRWVIIINYHHTCAWNIYADHKQLLILFHDLILTRMESNAVTKHINVLDKVHGTKDPIVVTRVKTHECLGMTFNFGLKMGVVIIQYDFIKNMC